MRLLNWLALENARIFRLYDARQRRRGVRGRALPGLYESGVRYERERDEVWSDVLNTYLQGHEDCDALAAIRAGEILARGHRALSPRDPDDPVRYPGDEGFALARKLRVPGKCFQAEVFLNTTSTPTRPGLYHCLTRYRFRYRGRAGDRWKWTRWFRDDPSARLGMWGDPDSPEVQQGLAMHPRRLRGHRR